jgi:phosphoglycolate phosphatase
VTAPARLVVFDVDGTLVDSQHHILAAMEIAFGAIAQPMPPRASVLGVVGLSLIEAMAALAPHLPEEQTLLLAAHYREGFVGQRDAGGPDAVPPLYPGARAALDRLAARPGMLLGVATGKARPGLDHLLAAHALAPLFATTQTADGHPSKPHPSMLRAALAETGCDPAEAVMVGDTEFDFAMGRAAGLRTIAVTWGYHPRGRLEAAGADLVIDDYAALDTALARLGSA